MLNNCNFSCGRTSNRLWILISCFEKKKKTFCSFRSSENGMHNDSYFIAYNTLYSYGYMLRPTKTEYVLMFKCMRRDIINKTNFLVKSFLQIFYQCNNNNVDSLLLNKIWIKMIFRMIFHNSNDFKGADPLILVKISLFFFCWKIVFMYGVIMS